MALELYRTLDCLGYVGPGPGMPAIKVELTEPVGGQKAALTVPVDTGFAGYILADRGTYEKLGTSELPREFFGTYRTMAGPVVLRRSKVQLGVGGKKYESYLETPLFGEGKLLAGRSVLANLDLALIGREGRCCLIGA